MQSLLAVTGLNGLGGLAGKAAILSNRDHDEVLCVGSMLYVRQEGRADISFNLLCTAPTAPKPMKRLG